MNSKAIRKQLLAAVAMVLVAAVALGSSTYAWFVSNNTVKATTTSISAQSNAPFLKIDSVTVTENSGTAKSLQTDPATETKLYPAQVVGTIASGTEAKFESAYASSASAANELANSRFTVGTTGTAQQAVDGHYAIKQTFYIGTSDAKAGSFKNLTVASVEINAEKQTTNSSLDSKLVNAMRVLVVGEDGWVVWKKGSNATEGWVKKYDKGAPAAATDITGFDAEGYLDDKIDANTSGKVDVYVYYDGADTDVYTNNLPDLTGCGVTITFTATPVNTDGTSVTNGSNAVDIPGNASAVVSQNGNELSVSVIDPPAGYAIYSYKWQKNGADAGTGATVTLRSASDDGSYTCEVTYRKTSSPDIVVTSSAFSATYHS